jgi:hypothetical protein
MTDDHDVPWSHEVTACVRAFDGFDAQVAAWPGPGRYDTS